jgi:hypothetical protein
MRRRRIERLDAADGVTVRPLLLQRMVEFPRLLKHGAYGTHRLRQ